MADSSRNAKTFSFEQGMFGGGVATIRDARLLAEDQYQRSTNCRPDPSGHVVKRLGFVEVDALTLGLGATVRASRWVVTESGRRVLIVWHGHGSVVSAYDGDTEALTEIATGLDTAGVIAHEEWGGKVYFSDGVNGLWSITVAGEAVSATASRKWGTYPDEHTLRAISTRVGVLGNLRFTVAIEDNVAVLDLSAANAILYSAGAYNGTWDPSKAIVVTSGTSYVTATAKLNVRAWNPANVHADPYYNLSHVLDRAALATDSALYLVGGASDMALAPGAGLTVPGYGQFTVQSAATVGSQYVVTLDAPLGIAIPHLTSVVPTSIYAPVGWATYAFTAGDFYYAHLLTEVNLQRAEGVRLTIGSGSDEVLPASGFTMELEGGIDAGGIGVLNETLEFSFVYLKARPASERLFGIDAEDRSNLRWCEQFDPKTWTGDEANVYSPGGNFTAIADAGDTLVPMTRDALYRIDGSDPATWRATKVKSDGLGCIAPGSVQILEGVPVYLSVRGLAYFDGQQPQILSADQFDQNNIAASLLPAADDAVHRISSLQTPNLYILFHSDNKAAVYDFRNGAWGGLYEYTFDVAACASNLLHDATMIPWIITPEGIIAKEEGHTDLGTPFTMTFASRDIDGGRLLLDKIFNDYRAAFIADAGTSVTLRLMCEDETQPRNGLETEQTYAAGGGVEQIRKRIRNARANYAHLEVAVTGGAFELVGVGAEFFFARAR